MIRSALSTLFVLLISLTTHAESVINCSAVDSVSAVYYRDISHAKFGEEIDIKTVLRETLIEHASRIKRMAKWSPNHSNPDSDYHQVLIDLLDESAGMSHEFSCFLPLQESGDIVQKFNDNEPMVYRDGYALFRNGVVIAYFYSVIGVV